MTTFECCANEILLEIFDYVDLTSLFDGFHCLNQRFNDLIQLHLQLNGNVDLRGLSKTHLKIICEKYLPRIQDRVQSVHLSNAMETPAQIEYFLHYGFSQQNWIHLRSMSLSHLKSSELFLKLFEFIDHCEQLIDLRFEQCQVDSECINDGSIFNRVWSLPKLQCFHFERKTFLWNPFFISSQIQSESIQSILLRGFIYTDQELNQLFVQTPYLKTLTIELERNYEPVIPTKSLNIDLERMKISVEYSPFVTNHLLHFMPRLRILIIELNFSLVLGSEWEHLIRQYLSNLEKFHLKMKFYFSTENSATNEVEQILKSFQTPFWIEEHRWYVQCHWFSNQRFFTGFLYTLPYYFKDFLSESIFNVRSTLPEQKYNPIFSQVKSLTIQSSETDFRFPNLHHLSLLFPAAVLLRKTFQDFQFLKSLTLKLSVNIKNRIQTQQMIQTMIHLCSLTVLNFDPSFHWLFGLKLPSIRQISFDESSRLDEDQYQKLIQSPLAERCYYLSVYLSNPIVVIDFIENLPHLLRSIHIHQYITNKRDILLKQTELVRWLNNHSSIQCSADFNSHEFRSSFYLWIR